MIARRWWHWHEDAWLLARLETPLGRALLMVAAALLLPATSMRAPIIAAVGLTTVAPTRRFDVLALASLWVLSQRLPKAVAAAGPVAGAVGFGTVLLLLVGCYAAARRFASLPSIVRRFPIVTLHAFLLGLLALSSYGVAQGFGRGIGGAPVATLAALIPFLLWRASYLILSGKRGTARATRLRDHLAYWIPVWGGSPTPTGKGHDYLGPRQAALGSALARVQAAGLKLLVLAALWRLLERGFQALHSSDGLALPALVSGGAIFVPELGRAIAESADTFSLPLRWLATAIGLLESVTHMAARGHVIVGVLRLTGFDVFRNTYKPLLATSIVEFWNRYYYYFKELLVEFFFYPTFISLARRSLATRIVVSVIAAATVGNFYYHLILFHRRLLGAGWEATLQWAGGRGIYCIVLGLAIAMSMLRERRRRGAGPADQPRWMVARTGRAIAGVWLFYGLLHIWNIAGHQLGIRQRFVFFVGLFGL